MFLGTLGATLLRNLLAGKVIVRAPYGKRTGNLMPSHSLTNFEIHKSYQNEPRFNSNYSRNNLPKTVKDGAYVIDLD